MINSKRITIGIVVVCSVLVISLLAGIGTSTQKGSRNTEHTTTTQTYITSRVTLSQDNSNPASTSRTRTTSKLRTTTTKLSSKLQTTTELTTLKTSTPSEKQCTLSNAIKETFGGTVSCLARIGIFTHAEAEDKCRLLNATLPLPRNQIEVSQFSTVMSVLKISSYNKVILGMTDYTSEGKWVDVDGKTVTFFNWYSNQPNNLGTYGQDYASISYAYQWGDWSGTTPGVVVCQQVLLGE